MNQLTPEINPAPLASTSEGMLDKKELASRLKMTTRTVENWQRRGIIPYVKIGKIVRFCWADVLAHLKTHFQVCRRTMIK